MPLRLLASGSNSHGQLGNKSAEDAHVFTESSFEGCSQGSLPLQTLKIVKIAGGANHTLALIEVEENKTQLWVCGDGRKGKLPLPQRTLDVAGDDGILAFQLATLGADFVEYRVADVAACWETTFVVLKSSSQNDKLIAMGSDDFGLRAQSPGVATKSYMNEVDLQDISSGSGRLSINSISCGPRHVVIHLQMLDTSGTQIQKVVGWGAARHGQLGPLTDPRSGRLLQYAPQPQAIQLQFPDDPIVELAAGAQHTAITHASGRLTLLGSDSKAQLRGFTDLTNVQSTQCTWNGTFSVLKPGVNRSLVVASGSNNKGQLGIGSQSTNEITSPTNVQLSPSLYPLFVACGSEHVLCVCTLLDNHGATEVWGWGWNEHGNLGNGTTEDVPTATRLWPAHRKSSDADSVASRETCVGIWAGCATSWIAVEVDDLQL